MAGGIAIPTESINDACSRGKAEERERIITLIKLIEADWLAADARQKVYACEYLRMQIIDTA